VASMSGVASVLVVASMSGVASVLVVVSVPGVVSVLVVASHDMGGYLLVHCVVVGRRRIRPGAARI